MAGHPPQPTDSEEHEASHGFFAESVTKAGGDGRGWSPRARLQWERSLLSQAGEAARSLNSIVLAAACQSAVFPSSLEEVAGRWPQEMQASGLIGTFPRYLFLIGIPWRYMFPPIWKSCRDWWARYYVLVLSVIVSLPEAELA